MPFNNQLIVRICQYCSLFFSGWI